MPGRSDQFTGLEKMIVIVANSLPDAVRGKLKLWCIEPKPNVFVSGVKDQLARKVVDLVLKYCPPESGILIFLEISVRAPNNMFQSSPRTRGCFL